MTDYQVEHSAARDIAKLHVESHDKLEGLSKTIPTDIDGGVGADLMLNILSAIATDAGSIAAIQADAANRMDTTVDLYDGIEEDAEEAFGQLAKEIP
ncbi:hypothetical protein [Tessaracoccus massiliensis]|uniref:hypothetical protein n=1 Tax=Tessaracoccus massiliensis TaxID=1522311 RepID=UPI00111B9583|nr:hypothetical protein [Tessaracoccus massiliensis]